MRAEEEPRLESRPRWPVGEVTDEVVVVVVEEEVVEELKSSCLLPKEPLSNKMLGMFNREWDAVEAGFLYYWR